MLPQHIEIKDALWNNLSFKSEGKNSEIFVCRFFRLKTKLSTKITLYMLAFVCIIRSFAETFKQMAFTCKETNSIKFIWLMLNLPKSCKFVHLWGFNTWTIFKKCHHYLPASTSQTSMLTDIGPVHLWNFPINLHIFSHSHYGKKYHWKSPYLLFPFP